MDYNATQEASAMNQTVTWQQLAATASHLSVADKVRLARQLLGEAEADLQQSAKSPHRKWSSIRGLFDYPMCGEDAQAWITQSRREADEHREGQLRRTQ
jgi:hypothetical protein